MSRELSGFGERSEVGDNGVAISGDGGSSSAGTYGIAISGDDGISSVGPSGVAITGIGGTAQAGPGGSISIMGEDANGIRYTVTGIIEDGTISETVYLLADTLYRLEGHSFEAAD